MQWVQLLLQTFQRMHCTQQLWRYVLYFTQKCWEKGYLVPKAKQIYLIYCRFIECISLSNACVVPLPMQHFNMRLPTPTSLTKCAVLARCEPSDVSLLLQPTKSTKTSIQPQGSTFASSNRLRECISLTFSLKR